MARDQGALDSWAEGEGEPLLLIRTALSAQHLVPLAREPALAEHFRLLTYDRRGYGQSPPLQGPGSLELEAADAAAVLDNLEADSAHVLGDSYSVAIALELALTALDRVRSLILIEPPPVLAPGADRFLAANRQLLDSVEADGVDAALEEFLGALSGPGWRSEHDGVVPGTSRRITQDAPAFFTADIPALLDWSLDAERATRLEQPMLHVAGTESGPLFATVHDWLHDLFPHVSTVSVPGAGHDVSFTHPAEVAAAVAEFLQQAGGTHDPGRRPGRS